MAKERNMNTRIFLCMALCCVGCAGVSEVVDAPIPEEADPLLVYPETRSEQIVETLHGVEVADPYRWLEDVNSEEVQQWMKSQDTLTRAELVTVSGLASVAAGSQYACSVCVIRKSRFVALATT